MNSSDAPPPVETWLSLSARPACSTACDRLAAADDRRGRRVGQRVRDGERAGGEARIFEDAHRAVPEHRAGPADLGREALDRSAGRCRRSSSSARDVVDRARARLAALALQVGGDHHVGRAAGSCRRGRSSSRAVAPGRLRAGSCRPRGPRALRNVLAMPPPMSSRSTRSIRFSSTPSLEETLAPPTIATNGRFGLLQRRRRWRRSPFPSAGRPPRADGAPRLRSRRARDGRCRRRR